MGNPVLYGILSRRRSECETERKTLRVKWSSYESDAVRRQVVKL